MEHTQALVRPQARQRLPPSETIWRSHQNALRINNAALGVALENTWMGHVDVSSECYGWRDEQIMQCQ